MPGRDDEIDTLVKTKFAQYSVSKQSNSNNGRHYLLSKDGETLHLKLVDKAYFKRNDESEIELLKQVDSLYVIKLLDSGDINDDWAYLLFPHIEGQTLDKLQVEAGWDDAKLKALVKDVVAGFKDLAKAKIVHRDIKPKNIIYDRVNDRYIIIDLGIGCYNQHISKDTTKIPRGIGPMFYTAPEQFRIAIGEPYSVSQATDQFSLGIVAYQLATNQHPFIVPAQENMRYYANLVIDQTPPAIPSSTGLSETTRNAIIKMLEREPSNRFLTNDQILTGMGIVPFVDEASQSKLFLKMPNRDKDEVIQFALENNDRIAGVVITPTEGHEIVEKLDNTGVNTLLDTSVYKLQTSKDEKMLSSKLGIPYTAQHNMITLYKIKNDLLKGAWELSDSTHSNGVVLPYFRIEGNESLILTKEIWTEARAFFRANSFADRKLYGGVVIPHSVIINEADRTKFKSTLIGRYDLDGIIVSLEDTNSSAATTVELEFLKGAKDLATFFESQFSEVIITRTDISVLPLLGHASYVAGWSKSFRHFQALASGGGGGNTDYKMKYFAPKLFTFIEEKPTIRAIVVMGKMSLLSCSCDDCAASNPLDAGYTEDQLRERGHYYNAVVSLQEAIIGKTVQQRADYFTQYLNDCTDAGNEIKSAGVIGNETIPSYVGLVSVIND